MKTILTAILAIAACTITASPTPPASTLAQLRETADSLHSAGHTDSAAIVGAEAAALAEKSGEAAQIVGAHSSLGVYLRSLGRVDEALEHYGRALEIVTTEKYRRNPDAESIEEAASVYINLAVLNLDMQHKEEAAKNAALAAEWVSRSDDPGFRSVVYGVAGSVMTGCGELPGAIEYQKKAYSDAIAAGNTDAAFRTAVYAMLTSHRAGDLTGAAHWRGICTELMPPAGQTMARLLYYQAECSICLGDGDRQGALSWFDRILALDGIDNLPFVKFDCYNNMHLAYAGLDDYRNAYNTLLKSNELRDSLWAQEKAESLRELTVRYETKEAELALSQSETRRTATLMWLFAATGLLLLAIILFVIYAGRQRRRRMLKEMEFATLRENIGRQLTRQYVEGLESERRRMAGELHDGVCNDLLAIQMNINNGNAPESTARLIDDCRESVRRISHELMPPEFAYASLDEVVRFFVTKHNVANAGKTSLTYTSSATGSAWTDIPDAVSLEVYRIIQEATGNAIRHSEATEIKVSLVLTGDRLEAAVSDNGTCRPSGKKGLGTESVRRRASSINGSVSAVIRPEGGTVVTLCVKI